jgi:hypothetical protein
MDTKTLINEAKARFSHKAAQDYLKEKYKNKFQIAAQQGLWRADEATINFLSLFSTKKLILKDVYGTPVEVNRKELLDTLKKLYTDTMDEYYKEWQELETKR